MTCSLQTSFIRDLFIHYRPHLLETTFTTDHIHNRPHSLQTRSLQTMFTTDHVHNRQHSREAVTACVPLIG